MAQHYLLLKSLHIFGVVIFLGNIIITGFWKFYADKTKNWSIIGFSQKLVTITDIYFTTLGVVIILITGLLMARNYGQFWHIKWIAWGLTLFIISGIIWAAILIPVQIKLHRMTKRQELKTIPSDYWRYEMIWMVFGTIATLLPLLNLYWMVFKPS